MAGTRSSARQAARGNNAGTQNDDSAAGAKRKADKTSSPQSKRTSKAPKKQTTIEETLTLDNNASEDKDLKDAPEADEEHHDQKEESLPTEENGNQTQKAPSGDEKGEAEVQDKTTDSNGAIKETSERKEKLPSNILEKGLVYFFTRNRVGIEDADNVNDLQRSYFVLRPLPAGAKIGDGAIQDLKNNRLFALPKKTLPKSHSDRFMAFVEKAETTIQDLKDNFFKGAEYETKTMGTRHQEPVTPIAEGVYAITRTEDRSTHLAYALTIPSELGEVQEDLGLRAQGSFIMSVKNPERPGPANARLPEAPKFPKEIIEEFRGLAWSEVKPNYLDYANTQILLIGEDIDKAVKPLEKDQKQDKDEPKEVLDELEHEDELRVKHLHGDDTIFDDLNISKKEYSQIPTTW